MASTRTSKRRAIDDLEASVLSRCVDPDAATGSCSIQSTESPLKGGTPKTVSMFSIE